MQNYIPLQYDRSHLEVKSSEQDNIFIFDYYDLALIVFNAIMCLAILLYYILTPRNSKQEIVLKVNQKQNVDIPHITYNRHVKKGKVKDTNVQKDLKDFNPYTQFPGYNLVELKCLKCSHSTEIYQPKTQQNTL